MDPNDALPGVYVSDNSNTNKNNDSEVAVSSETAPCQSRDCDAARPITADEDLSQCAENNLNNNTKYAAAISQVKFANHGKASDHEDDSTVGNAPDGALNSCRECEKDSTEGFSINNKDVAVTINDPSGAETDFIDNSYLTIEHCYSKVQTESEQFHNQPTVETGSQSEPESGAGKFEMQGPGTCGLLDQDYDKGNMDGGFVSSLIEVIDDVEQNLGVKPTDSDSDSDTSATDSDSDSSDSTSSDSSIERVHRKYIELAEEVAALKSVVPPKVQGEILPSDLPPVEDMNICLPENCNFEPVGKVSHIVSDNTVIIKSHQNKPALDSNTVLFFTKQLALGRVEETFGPVPCPYYAVRFNNKEHICSKGVETGREVFYAPEITDFTSYVFVSALKQLRGSDASWINDVEPPPTCIDYSDDEQEREARKQRRKRHTDPDAASDTNKGEKDARSGGRGRGRGRRKNDNWHNRSVKVSVSNSFEECQNGWQNAVSGMYRRHVTAPMQSNLPPPAYEPPRSLLDCFRVPPPPFMPDVPPPPAGYRGPRFSQQGPQPSPAASWPMSPQFPPNFHMFNYGVPPPPPPPPPSAPPPSS